MLLRSPLADRHEALGAKFAAFGGWEMPLEYAGGGVLKEHSAVRTSVGVFDVSHLGKVGVVGPGAADFVNACLTNDLGRIAPGRAQYTMCCDDAVADEHRTFAILAVQGPESAAALTKLGLPTDLEYMSFSASPEVVVCRTGYTGEHGYELVLPWDRAAPVWGELMAAGVQPCGLGARDTLRTEMGYPLHGQDLSLDITPVQARAGWAVGWSKPAFWGREALLAEKAEGPRRTLRGLEMTGRGIPRGHMTVYAGDQAVGETTSGTFSPTKKVGIALALLDTSAGLADGDLVEVDIRGRRAEARIVKPPFVQTSVR
jgi:glycine cleavage system T protein (aminomethyltransferase)